MNLGTSLKDNNLAELSSGKGFKKSMSNIRKSFFMLLSLMLGLTWQFNAYAQELDYADKSGKAAEIIKKSKQYQDFLAFQEKIAQENGDRVRKFETFVDGYNTNLINTTDDLSDIVYGAFPNINIHRKTKIKNFEFLENYVVLNDSGNVTYLSVSPKYSFEIKYVIENFNALKGLSIRNDNSGLAVLDLKKLKNVSYVKIHKSKYKKLILPSENEIVSLEILFTPINEISNLKSMTSLQNLVLDGVKIKSLNELTENSYLQRMDIISSSNSIKEIPDLSGFINLVYLTFNSKNIEEIKNISSLKSLKRLSVGSSFNFQEIDFPDSLVHLQLAGMQNTRMPNLKGNINLKDLTISRTRIRSIERLEELEKLNLIKNEISEISGLNNLKNLKVLNLLGNGIMKIQGLSKLVGLEKINLQYNKIEKIEGFENLPNLESVLLGYNEIKEIDAINFMTWLDVLSLNNNPIDTFDYQSIVGLENTKLIIRDTPLSDVLTDEEKEKYYDTHRYLRF
ncbi:leucine-rich repeat domain-containing protein [Marinomonas sp. MED121]|uniref:leucine-rich repeat domain-containing protein n=1 Tax=Marinomonas sp. MED121 TaxID=314277 RepID=UPI0002F4A568|nr:leucine-rich repeat domain-containing protein [Marinomonas sp. MED121]